MTMLLRVALIGLSTYLCAGAIYMKNWPLAGYWVLVGCYWIFNMMEAIR